MRVILYERTRHSRQQVFYLKVPVTPAPIKRVALWDVCSFNVVRIESFFKSKDVSRASLLQKQTKENNLICEVEQELLTASDECVECDCSQVSI